MERTHLTEVDQQDYLIDDFYDGDYFGQVIGPDTPCGEWFCTGCTEPVGFHYEVHCDLYDREREGWQWAICYTDGTGRYWCEDCYVDGEPLVAGVDYTEAEPMDLHPCEIHGCVFVDNPTVCPRCGTDLTPPEYDGAGRYEPIVHRTRADAVASLLNEPKG